MGVYALIGMLVVAAIFAAGANWVVRNISFKPTKNPYTYMSDTDGHDYVQDNTVKSKDESNV